MPPSVGAELTLGGRKRLLRYTAPALVKIQRELGGTPLGDTMGQVQRVSVRHVSVLVWGGLLHETPDLDVEDAAALIEPPIRDVISAVVDALEPWIATRRAAAPTDPEPPEASEKKSATT